MLGKEIYYVDLDTDQVKKGIVNAEMIDNNGYHSYRIQTDKGYTYRIKPYVFNSEIGANKALSEMKPIADEMKRIQKEAQSMIDSLREKINGKPEFEVQDGKDSE